MHALGCMQAKSLSRVRCSATPRTVALQVPLCMGFSRPEYWSRFILAPPGDRPNPGIEPESLALAGDSLPPSLLRRWVSLVAQSVKHVTLMWETRVRSLGGEDPLEKGMATHSSILAWRIPCMEEPGGLQSMGSQSQTQPSNFTFFLFS